MDWLTDYLAKRWTNFDDYLENLVKRRVLNSFNSTFLFFFGFVALFGLIISLLPSFDSVSLRIIYFFGYALTAFVGLTIAATYMKRKAIKAKRLYPFVFKKVDFNLVDFELLQFDNEEKIDFSLLLNRRKVQNKINFKEMNKSKESASHPKLFSMLHVLLEDGISEIKDNRLKIFFEMLQDSFLMNDKSINSGTLKTSFANWKGDLNSDKVKDYNQYYREIFKIEK